MLSPLPLLALALGACVHRPPAALPVDWLDAGERALLLAGPAEAPLALLQVGPPADEALLRRPALPLDPGEPLLGLLEARLRATLIEAGGVGIAAPQVGISRRVILVERQDLAVDPDPAPVAFYLDPALTWSSPEQVRGWEGCLSIPGLRGEVERAERVRVAWLDDAGVRREEEVGGWTARIFQHEIDHLDGALYSDRTCGPLIDVETWRRLRETPPPQPTPADPAP